MERPVVELAWSEILLAGQAGIMRRVQSLKLGWTEISVSENPWGNEVMGAIAELAVAKYYNVYWASAVGHPGEPDIGPYQVRSKAAPHHRLIVHKKALDTDVYISALVEPPRVTLCGWLMGYEAKDPRWWRDMPPPKASAFFVPDSSLHPMADLPNPSACARIGDVHHP